MENKTKELKPALFEKKHRKGPKGTASISCCFTGITLTVKTEIFISKMIIIVNNNNLRLLRLRQTAQPTMITTTACHAGQQQQGLARA